MKNYTDVTDEMLRNPDPADWLMARRNYLGWSHTPLTQVTRENVKELQLAWVWAMNESGAANEPTPIVHNGTMFLTNPGNVLQALDAKTGDLIWEHRVGPNATVGIAAMRNMAIYQDKVFLATTDARLTALDARTGKLVWDTPIADRAKGYANTAGPMVVKGVVVNGLVGCDRYGNDGCWISGYDAATGKQLWKFNTVRRGSETGSETWGKLADNLRVGGETWIAGSYDPDLDLMYWGIAQAKPWMRASRGSSNFDNVLYTSSTVALRPKDGTLAWHYQHAPGESLDLDEVFERVLVDIGDQKVVFTIGKPGILWKLDRRTGAFLAHKETVFQNVFESIDPKTGVPQYRGDILEQQTGQWVQSCPSTEGGHNWQAMSYHPRDGDADHPAQPVVHGDVGPQARIHQRLGRHGRRPALLRDAGQRGECRQAGGVRREDDEGSMEPRAARVLPHLGLDDRQRRRLRRRSRSRVPRLRRADGRDAVAGAARHLGAGLPGGVQRRRPRVHRGDDRPRRRQPAAGAENDQPRREAPAERQCDLRLRAAGARAVTLRIAECGLRIDCGMRNADCGSCGIELLAPILNFRNPQSAIRNVI